MIGKYHIRHKTIAAYKLEYRVLGRCPLYTPEMICGMYDAPRACMGWTAAVGPCAMRFIYRYIVRPDGERG